ncbi:Tat pathway signal sequence domain protein [Gordonia amarae]|uniref:Tat pathway signal sequence domain protein n=1 Tax=Gordonia amarae TaxID=36821 RepID=A0A857LUZ6_9ACTN|nr:Tat pathway signal sequence domain protein [Gordonia amarae]QHN24143.1 Tat pathway signal sequence domain protein [Gordonia amarae]QHN33061.1 Tat pathway signal sequence domain protein [Gordonia amarae]QHN41783.1 Tat pathway signal sequence domain protein [Gordonia amarae]
MTRRAALAGFGALVLAAVAACSDDDSDSGSGSSSASPKSSGTGTATGDLVFDPASFTEKTATISAADGSSKKVTYRFYGPITYVTKPVDETYQCLTVSVPTEIDGKKVDASTAPIVFANSVGGYMPSSVAEATAVGGGQMVGMGTQGSSSSSSASGSSAPTSSAASSSSAAASSFAAPSSSAAQSSTSASGTEVESGGNAMLNSMGKMVSIPEIALAEGFVVVEPGARGRTLVSDSGDYYGTAPAVIVDLKAAVRYVRFNEGRIPGRTDRIVSTGTSAGGAVSALLGASGDSDLYSSELAEIGAADASDAVYATGSWCPITDLEHADAAYEFCWGANPYTSSIDTTVTKELAAQFAEYQDKLKLEGRNGFGALNAGNYHDYLLREYLIPSATTYLSGLSTADRQTYLKENSFITYSSGKASFTWDGFTDHVGTRKKPAPAFDAFDLSLDINNLFGHGTEKARHITEYSQKRDTTGLKGKALPDDTAKRTNQMNPMYHIAAKNPGRSKQWWIRLGTKDSDTSLTISTNLTASLVMLGDKVDHLMYWDQGHGANDDADDFLAWVRELGSK